MHFARDVVPFISGGVAVHCVLPFLDDVIFSYSCVTVEQQSLCSVCARANTPGAWYWLRPVLDDGARQGYMIPRARGVGAVYAVYHCLV